MLHSTSVIFVKTDTVFSASGASSAFPFSENTAKVPRQSFHVFQLNLQGAKFPEKSGSGLNLRFQPLFKSELKFSPKLPAPRVIYQINKVPAGQLHSN